MDRLAHPVQVVVVEKKVKRKRESGKKQTAVRAFLISHKGQRTHITTMQVAKAMANQGIAWDESSRTWVEVLTKGKPRERNHMFSLVSKQRRLLNL